MNVDHLSIRTGEGNVYLTIDRQNQPTTLLVVAPGQKDSTRILDLGDEKDVEAAARTVCGICGCDETSVDDVERFENLLWMMGGEW